MAKYTSRIKNLIRRTHNFISHESLCMSRDYFNEQFEECAKTPDFEQNWAEYNSLGKLYMESKGDESIIERANILVSEEPGVYYKERLKFFSGLCEYPEVGVLVPKYRSAHFVAAIMTARAHFVGKKKDG